MLVVDGMLGGGDVAFCCACCIGPLSSAPIGTCLSAGFDCCRSWRIPPRSPLAQPVHSPKSFMELFSSGVAEPLLPATEESCIGTTARVLPSPWVLNTSPTRTTAATDGMRPFGDFLLTNR